MNTRLWGLGIFRPHRVVRSVPELQDVPFDYVICANKNVHSNESTTADAIRSAVRPTTTLVSVHNGINVEQPLRSAFTRNLILSAICYVSCQQTGPGLVEQVAQIRPHAFHVGAFDHETDNAELEESNLQALVGLEAKFKKVKDLKTERWIKMVFNGSWNPVAALTGCDTHQILGNSRCLAVVKRLADEISEVAVKSGANLPRDSSLRALDDPAREPPITLSMLQDVRNGRRLEIEPLCGKSFQSKDAQRFQKLTRVQGNILRQARLVGVPVPGVKAMYDLLLNLDRDGLMRPEFAPDFLGATLGRDSRIRLV